MCVCACVHVCVHACACVCMCVRASVHECVVCVDTNTSFFSPNLNISHRRRERNSGWQDLMVVWKLELETLSVCVCVSVCVCMCECACLECVV